MSSTWENSRKHARALEARLETKLTSYSKLAAQISSGSPRPSSDKLSEQEEGIGGHKLMEEEIEELLEKVSRQEYPFPHRFLLTDVDESATSSLA
jgi:Golgi SNAP receptor complex protein 1